MGEAILTRPKLIRDFAGGYVRSNRAIENGLAEMPVGTVFKVESSGVAARLKSLPCSCCGIRMRVTIKGRDKFNDFDWLGYEPPGRAVGQDGCETNFIMQED